MSEKNSGPLGATGEFPQGKLKKDDEGELRFAITVINGKIVIDFGKPVAWIGLDADTAAQIATTLLKRAGELKARG